MVNSDYDYDDDYDYDYDDDYDYDYDSEEWNSDLDGYDDVYLGAGHRKKCGPNASVQSKYHKKKTKS